VTRHGSGKAKKPDMTAIGYAVAITFALPLHPRETGIEKAA